MTKAKAIQYFTRKRSRRDGVANLAKALGISHQAVYKWGKYPPTDRQDELEHITEGALQSERTISAQKARAKLKEALAMAG